MCLCSIQCWLRRWWDEHSCSSNNISQSWSSTSHGSNSKHSHTQKWITNHRFNARFSHNFIYNDLQRCLLHSPTIHINSLMVHRCKLTHQSTSSNNHKTCNAVDRQASYKCSSPSQQILKSYHKLPSKVKSILGRIVHLQKRWLGPI